MPHIDSVGALRATVNVTAEATKRLKKVMNEEKTRENGSKSWTVCKSDLISAPIGGASELNIAKVPLCCFKKLYLSCIVPLFSPNQYLKEAVLVSSRPL